MAKYPAIVSLVSEQAAPTVLFATDYIKANPGKYELLFLSTERMEKKGTSKNLMKAISLKCRNAIGSMNVVTISHDDYDNIGRTLKESIPLGSHYIVNLTGGTKIMSIAVYEYFKNKTFTPPSELFYLTLGKNSFAKIFPEHLTHGITVRLSLEEYLTAYGIKYNSQNSCIGDWEKNKNFAMEIFPKYKKLISNLVRFQNENYVKSRFKKKKNLDLKNEKVKEKLKENGIELSSLQEVLASANFSSEELSRNQLRYITGGWFEEFTYQKIKREQGIPEESIALNVTYVAKEGKVNFVSNELDVLYINSRNGLSIVECKSSIPDKEKILTGTFYKMAALRKEFGLQAKSYLYTMSTIGKENDRNRAESLNIAIRDKTDLLEA